MHANWQLNPTHSGSLLRFKDLLNHLRGFHSLIVQHNNPAYRDGLIEQLRAANPDQQIIDLKSLGGFYAFEQAIAELNNHPATLHVINLESLDKTARQEFFRGINYHREYIARHLNTTLVLWMVEPQIRDIALHAADFWAWREQVLDFSLPVENQVRWDSDWQKTTGLDKEKKQQRIQEILTYLEPLGNEEATISVADMLHELGNLYEEIGEYTLAKQSLEQARHSFVVLDEKHASARVLMDLAYLRFRQGEPAEALALLENKVLPCFKDLSDLKHQAAAQSRIADILQARGQLDEALNIRQNDELPVYETLGDVRAKAVTMGKIADILEARGQLDEALNIRQNEELPVYEKLGDVRNKAVTMGKIADILKARGQLDEALNIRQNEELPAFEKLGDVREKAVTMGRIADILKARGQLDEALNTLQNEVLPIFEKLGDVQAKATIMGRIADILKARGQLDEALSIRQNEELPVYEKLGDVREKAITMGKIADILWEQNPQAHAETVRDYLTEALAQFESMQLPNEIKWIEGVFKNTGLPREGEINPKLFLTLNDGDVLYPEPYAYLFSPETDDAKRCEAGLHRIDIPYYSGKQQLTLWTGFHLAPNENNPEIDTRAFLDLLITSVSLDTTTEKNRVIEQFPSFSQFQIDELTKVFTEEQAKFIELGKEHPEYTDRLQNKMVRGWLIWEESQAITT